MKFKKFALLGLHTELWVDAPTSQPKTDGAGKSEAFGDNLRSGCTLMVKLQLQAQVGLADSGFILYMEFVEGNIVGQ